ncbi:MAG: WbuC family cupin fold metalloprotein [Phycisphaeraceae bacterium]|nr:WbuC family cupin fold metalloprotein [Phycisphaeraceae bacterium]
MPSVFTHHQEVFAVGPDWLDRLRQEAAAAPLGRARLCLHRRAEEAIQEMVIAFRGDSLVRPHRHRGRSESLHVVRGKLAVLIFDEAGRVTQRVNLAALGEKCGTGMGMAAAWMYRLSEGLWHTVVPRSEDLVVHEVTQGPFDPAEQEFAPFGPAEDGALRKFIEQALNERP